MKLDWTEVSARIAAGGDERPERKLSDAFPGAAVTGAITGFANADGGLVILGVTDYGSLAGGPGEVEDVQEKLDTLLHTGLSAPVPAALGHHAESGVALQPPAVVGSARTES